MQCIGALAGLLAMALASLAWATTVDTPPGKVHGPAVNASNLIHTEQEPCYTSLTSRFAALSGRWRSIDSTKPRYWNLSCPFEWGKYSCVHQGALEHATTSLRLQFEPAEGCAMLYPSIDAKVFPSCRQLHFVGDSLIRQVFISMTCLLGSEVVARSVQWPSCQQKKRRPCHQTKNCISCGEHSGFGPANVTLASGSKVLYGPGPRPRLDSVGPCDVIVVEAGVHGKGEEPARDLLHNYVPQLLKRNASVIWLITPQPAFKSPLGTGVYDAKYLAAMTSKKSKLACKQWVPATRSADEWRVLRGGADILAQLLGVVELEGLNGLGHAKIGGGVGAFGDCQHYCMPGVPDVLARAVFTMLRATARA